MITNFTNWTEGKRLLIEAENEAKYRSMMARSGQYVIFGSMSWLKGLGEKFTTTLKDLEEGKKRIGRIFKVSPGKVMIQMPEGIKSPRELGYNKFKSKNGFVVADERDLIPWSDHLDEESYKELTEDGMQRQVWLLRASNYQGTQVNKIRRTEDEARAKEEEERATEELMRKEAETAKARQSQQDQNILKLLNQVDRPKPEEFGQVFQQPPLQRFVDRRRDQPRTLDDLFPSEGTSYNQDVTSPERKWKHHKDRKIYDYF